MRQRRLRCIVSATVGLILIGLVGLGAADSDRHFEVTVTNLTRGQVFTPILVASHKQGVHLFQLGAPASAELATLAEAGDTAPLTALLESLPEVKQVTNSGAPLLPGDSVTLTVATRGLFRFVSVAAMLVPTNDAFFAVNGVRGPSGDHVLVLYSPAYDAGSEHNDELCAAIPGPPGVCGGEGESTPAANDEGYVHIHAGIHGIGDLIASERDWRNPVAKIVIRRLP